jgi:predicted transposase YdaD
MKTDKWFYQLFLTQPGMLAELLPGIAPEWEFDYTAPVIKEREFRLDGVLCPQSDDLTIPVIFLEAQMQTDEGFYGRYFAEIFLYLQQYPAIRPWQGLLLLKSRQQRLGSPLSYSILLQNHITCFYLEDLLTLTALSPNLALLKILVVEQDTAFALGQGILRESDDPTLFQQRLNLLETILVNKFPHLGAEDILKMLDLKTADLTQSRFYQEVTALGRQEEAAALVLRQLTRKCGQLTPAQVAQVEGLELEALERLGEDLLDFSGAADLGAWLG